MVKQIKPLSAYWEQIEDSRKAKGLRHPLGAVLNLCSVALMAGAKTPKAIATYWKNRQPEPELLARLGFSKPYGPSQSTLYEVLSQVKVTDLERALTAWMEESLVDSLAAEAGELEGMSLDGKTLKGSRKQGSEIDQVLSLFSHRLGMTIAQLGIPSETNEIGVLPDLLVEVVLEGRVFTMDALHTQVETAKTIVEQGGDYVMVVKRNQPQLYEALQTLFEQPGADPFIHDQASTFEAAHGRLQQRTLVTSLALTDYLDWPGSQQVFRIDRHTTLQKSGRVRAQTSFGITSLSPDQADAAALLALVRQHWHIENRSHYVRDVSFGEDASQVRRGSLPQVMAALRNCAINLIRCHDFQFIPDAFDYFAVHYFRALDAIGC